MLRLSTRDRDFAAAFDALVADTREGTTNLGADVAAIIARVKAEGFAAIAELTRRFDQIDVTAETAEVPHAARAAAAAQVPDETRAALELAAARIRAFHMAQRPADGAHQDATGTRAGWRWTPVERAGLYVPGGRAAYPSSVLMNALPALVAGVDELVMCVPTPGGQLNPLVMLAAELAGVARVFRIGGAQAIAAMAFGTAARQRLGRGSQAPALRHRRHRHGGRPFRSAGDRRRVSPRRLGGGRSSLPGRA